MSNHPLNTILIVDDDPTNLSLLFDHLEQTGLKVLIAVSGEAALEAVHYAPPDIILLDIILPGIDGFETCRQLQADEQTRNIPIIFMTGLDEGVGQLKGLELGAVDYITKPIQVETVLARIRPYLTIHNLHHMVAEKERLWQEEHLARQRAEASLQDMQGQLNELNKRPPQSSSPSLTDSVTRPDVATRPFSPRSADLQTMTLQRELAIARVIQHSILPPVHPGWSDLDLICYTTSAREIGGDFYVYHKLESTFDVHHQYIVGVGDVTGRGIPAALLMSLSLASFQATAGQGLSPEILLNRLDKAISYYTRETRQSCAFSCVEIDPKRPALRSVNAGGVPPYVKRQKMIRATQVGGVPLGRGRSERRGYEEFYLELAPKDMIVLASDGIIDATNVDGQKFGFEQFEMAIASGPTTHAQALLKYILRRVADFTAGAEQNDDQTLVVMQV